MIADVRSDYLSYISDTSISLAERWAVFTETPDNMKEHESCYVTFECEQQMGEISWYDDFYLDRGNVITTANMIELWRNHILDEEDEDPEDKKWTQYLDSVKEEVLARNLGSFTNDW
jgi:hypothetical protein